jgi:hypothetical protein
MEAGFSDFNELLSNLRKRATGAKGGFEALDEKLSESE